MNKKIITIVFGFLLLTGLFAKANYDYYAEYLKKLAISDAQDGMFFHLIDNGIKPQPFNFTGCDFRDSTLIAYPYLTFHSWDWSDSIACNNPLGKSACVNLVLGTLWCQSGSVRTIVAQKCTDITQNCGTSFHFVSDTVASTFPSGFPPGTYWLNVAIWDGSCSYPGSNLIRVTNSPTYILQ